MAAEVHLYKADKTTIDVMASPIVQNTSGTPNYIWLSTSSLETYGDVGQALGTILPFQKSVAYKARILDEIAHHDDPLQRVGSLDCITNPGGASCDGRGPFEINGVLYYIDFSFFYIVNVGDAPAYAPIISVDTSRCDAYYGFILASPKVSVGASADVGGLVVSAPKYANFLNSLEQTTTYEWTAVDATGVNLSSQATPNNIRSVVSSSIANGQYPVTMKDAADNPITLNGQQSGGASDYYQPFMLIRYIHESAPTRKIDINISISYHV